MVTEHNDGTKQFVNDNIFTKLLTVEIADNSKQTKTIRIWLPQSPFHDTVNNSNIRPRLIPLSTVSTANYQCGRLLKGYSITAGCQKRETTALQSFSPSPHLRTINTSKKLVCVNNIQIHSGQKKTKIY